MSEITACATCGGERLRPVLDLGDQPLAERDDGKTYPLAVAECLDCGLAQLTYEADRAEVFPPDHPYATGNTAALRGHFDQLAALAAGLLRPGDLIADIGANDGTFLAAVRRRAPEARLLGIEPTGQAEAMRRKAIPAERRFFTSAAAREIRRYLGPATVITASNVLAHMSSPHDVMSGVAELLAPGGTFIAECHDWASVVNGLQFDAVYHEHLRYYTPATLGCLLEMHGFLVTSAVPVSTHGGSFRIQAVRQQPGLEQRARAAADQLLDLVRTAAREGPVYGVGATTRATGLIRYAGIAPFLDRVAEVPGSMKIGTLIPGTAIPVTPEADLIENQPPHALLLAWHLAGSLIPALRVKGYEGRFIIPLPEPHVTRR